MNDDQLTSEKNGGAQADSGNLAECDVTKDDIDALNKAVAPGLWLETLSPSTAMMLAIVLTNIMTEGLTPEQQNLLGSFISTLGSIITYKAAREDVSTSSSPNTFPR